MEEVECGAAALGIILRYYGRFVPLAQLRSECGVSRDGSQPASIVKVARNYGLQAKAFKKQTLQLAKMQLPAIAFWNFSHLLVVEGFEKDKVYLNDPATGPRTVSLPEFEEAYIGEIIGEMSFVDDRLPSATVKTVEPTIALSLSKRQLQMKMERDPDFAARFYQELASILSSRLRSLSKLLAQSKIVPGQALRKVLFLFAVLNDNDIDWCDSLLSESR